MYSNRYVVTSPSGLISACRRALVAATSVAQTAPICGGDAPWAIVGPATVAAAKAAATARARRRLAAVMRMSSLCTPDTEKRCRFELLPVVARETSLGVMGGATD